MKMNRRRFPGHPLPFLCLGLALMAACNVDGIGLFWSASTPNERFAQSRAVPDPVWAGGDPGTGFSFVFVTDSHLWEGKADALSRFDPLLGNDLLVVHGGDITQCGYAEDAAAFQAWRDALPIPVYASPGNHDLYFSGWNQMGPVLGQSSYTVRVAPWFRLVVLDSANATLGSEQYAWLAATLEAAGEAVIVVATHYPLFSTGFGEINWSDPEEGASLMRLFERRGVDLVLAGHTHAWSERTVGGTRYLVAAACLDPGKSPAALRIQASPAGLQVTRIP